MTTIFFFINSRLQILIQYIFETFIGTYIFFLMMKTVVYIQFTSDYKYVLYIASTSFSVRVNTLKYTSIKIYYQLVVIYNIK